MPEDPETLADDLDRQADELEQRNQALGKGIDDARSEWEKKRADPAVPGAQPRTDDDAPAPGQAPSAAASTGPEDPAGGSSSNPGAGPVESGP